MSKEYLPDKEKRILLSAISREERVIKENNLSELIPVVRNLDYKFMYDRLFRKIEDEAYQQGRAEERERIVKELEKLEDSPADDSMAEIVSTRIWNKAIHKAISDMEKLEKIEQFIEDNKCGHECDKCEEQLYSLCEIPKIEQIVKG